MTVVDVSVAGEVRREQVEEARRAILELTPYTHGDRIQSARLTVRRSHSRHFLHRPYVADASVLIDGRVLAAHVTGPTPEDAAKAAAGRLRLQVRRVRDGQEVDRAVGALPEPALRAWLGEKLAASARAAPGSVRRDESVVSLVTAVQNLPNAVGRICEVEKTAVGEIHLIADLLDGLRRRVPALLRQDDVVLVASTLPRGKRSPMRPSSRELDLRDGDSFYP